VQLGFSTVTPSAEQRYFYHRLLGRCCYLRRHPGEAPFGVPLQLTAQFPASSHPSSSSEVVLSSTLRQEIQVHARAQFEIRGRLLPADTWKKNATAKRTQEVIENNTKREACPAAHAFVPPTQLSREQRTIPGRNVSGGRNFTCGAGCQPAADCQSACPGCAIKSISCEWASESADTAGTSACATSLHPNSGPS
jgi:hypothetical protein